MLAAGLPLSAVSLFMSAAVLGRALAQWPLGWISDNRNPRFVLILASILTGRAALALTFLKADGTALLALATLYGSGMLPLYSLSVAHANDYAARGAARRAGSLDLFRGVRQKSRKFWKGLDHFEPPPCTC